MKRVEARTLRTSVWIAPAGLLVVALLLRVVTLIIWPFDGLYGQDPYFYDAYGRALGAALMQGETLPRTLWPVGYPLLLALTFPLHGVVETAGQWISILTGAAIAPLVYLLARELLLLHGRSTAEARWIGLVAGLLAAVSGQLWQSSVVVMSDAPALFWATLSAWALVRFGRRPRLFWILTAALAVGWAGITRWEYVLLAFPFAAFVWPRTDVRPYRWHFVIAVLAGAVLLGLQLLLLERPTELGRAHGSGWALANAFRREFVTGAGADRYAWPTAIFYARPLVSPGYLLPLFTPALLLGSIVVLWRRWYSCALVLLGWSLLAYAALAGLPFQNFRYSLVYLPPVMILTAVGVHWIVEQTRGRWRVGAYGVVLLGVLVMAGWSGSRVGDFITTQQEQKAIVRWAAERVPAGATLLSHGLTLIAQHETAAYEVFDLYLLTTADLARLTTDSRPDYLLVDSTTIEAQWAGRAPEQNYHWLRDGPGLRALGQRGGYTLFAVGSGGR